MATETADRDVDLDDLPDHRLLQIGTTASGSRSERAFQILHERLNDGLVSFLKWKISGASEEEVEEVASEAWRRLYAHGHRHDPQVSKVRSYLFMIASRLATNALRDHARRPTEPISNVEEKDPDDERGFFETTPAGGRSPSDEQSLALTEEALEDALDEIRDIYEVPLRLRLSGHDYEEISDRTGQKLGTVKSRLHRARSRVAEQLRERGVTLDVVDVAEENGRG